MALTGMKPGFDRWVTNSISCEKISNWV